MRLSGCQTCPVVCAFLFHLTWKWRQRRANSFPPADMPGAARCRINRPRSHSAVHTRAPKPLRRHFTCHASHVTLHMSRRTRHAGCSHADWRRQKGKNSTLQPSEERQALAQGRPPTLWPGIEPATPAGGGGSSEVLHGDQTF